MALISNILFPTFPEEFQNLDHFLEDYLQSKELKCLVELGVHTGASTWMLSRHLEEKSLIIGVDCGLFPGLKYSQQVYTKLSQEGFICHFLEETTENALNKVKFLSIQGIDILHLDANESYENVKKDWQNYAPLMNPGGIVLIHDIEYIPGIKTFWNEIKVSKKFQEIRNGGQGMGIIVLP